MSMVLWLYKIHARNEGAIVAARQNKAGSTVHTWGQGFQDRTGAAALEASLFLVETCGVGL